jgi:hypothetical protein
MNTNGLMSNIVFASEPIQKELLPFVSLAVWLPSDADSITVKFNWVMHSCSNTPYIDRGVCFVDNVEPRLDPDRTSVGHRQAEHSPDNYTSDEVFAR